MLFKILGFHLTKEIISHLVISANSKRIRIKISAIFDHFITSFAYLSNK